MSKFSEAFSLMERCIKSCESLDQLEITMDWVDDAMIKEKYPEADTDAARSLLSRLILERSGYIIGIGDIEEIELKSGH